MYDSKAYYFNTSFLKILSYKAARYLLVLVLSLIYYRSWQSNSVIGIIMTLLFAYCVAGVISLVLHFVIYAFSKPKLIEGSKDVIANNIPNDTLVVFFRPIFAKSNPEMENLLLSMEKDIQNNQNIGGDQKYIVIDNTRDEAVKGYIQSRIKDLQSVYGKKKVFYMHRNKECDFFKKVGILHDAIMLIYEGWTRPRTYIDQKWQAITKGTRNPNTAVWDIMLGDISSLGIDAAKEDIYKGKDVNVNKADKFKIVVVSDADNFWEKGEFIKIAAKILNPLNKDFVIYQPSIEIINPRQNRFIYLTYLARRMYEYEPIGRWRLFGFSPFYGKGVFNLRSYVREIIKTEWLNPEKAASHDFQEALRAWSVLCEDAFIYEKTFSNKLSELKRAAQWGWGDLETVRQFLFKKFQPGRRAHLFVLLRGLIACVVYGIWLLASVVLYETGMMKVKHPLLLTITLSGIVLISILVPKLFAPLLDRKKKRLFVHEIQDFEKNNLQLLKEASSELVVSNLVHKLDLIYKPWAFIQNLSKQIQSKPFVWKTGAMGELETQNMKPFGVYKELIHAPIAGILILALIFNNNLSHLMAFILLPYYSSFLLGPYFIWKTSKGMDE